MTPQSPRLAAAGILALGLALGLALPYGREPRAAEAQEPIKKSYSAHIREKLAGKSFVVGFPRKATASHYWAAEVEGEGKGHELVIVGEDFVSFKINKKEPRPWRETFAGGRIQGGFFTVPLSRIVFIRR